MFYRHTLLKRGVKHHGRPVGRGGSTSTLILTLNLTLNFTLNASAVLQSEAVVARHASELPVLRARGTPARDAMQAMTHVRCGTGAGWVRRFECDGVLCMSCVVHVYA